MQTKSSAGDFRFATVRARHVFDDSFNRSRACKMQPSDAKGSRANTVADSAKGSSVSTR